MRPKKHENMKAKIQSYYGVFGFHEISVDWNGFNFLVIYGKHVNGWFIAIPNWKICIEATEPDDYWYNVDKLSDAFNNADMGKAVSMAIKEHWEGLQNADM